MKVGIVALLHESNTFVHDKTTLQNFEDDILLTGEPIRIRMQSAEHEVAGFFSGLEAAGIEAVPVFAARAYPSGVIDSDTFDELLAQMLYQLQALGPFDGILAAPHGATVSGNFPDADGHWLSEVRSTVGENIPVVATIDPHANVSELMVASTDALVAYRTNPHLDQKETGIRAAELLVQILKGNATPTQAAALPPVAINIQSQNTSSGPVRLLNSKIESICSGSTLSHSLALGFPYSDVPEMGSSVIVVTDDDKPLAEKLADRISDEIWSMRHEFEPEFLSVPDAVRLADDSKQRTLMLDMGDNVGGGAPGNGTAICSELHRQDVSPSFVCLYDPESAARAESSGPGNRLPIEFETMTLQCEVLAICDGHFSDGKPSHGGFQHYNQGRTAVVKTDRELTIMLTSLRMPPFSLQQLLSCEIDPLEFRVIVAKGVIAPLAAYQSICNQILHVNTPGPTCADMKQLPFTRRRNPMFPFEGM